MNQQNGTLFFRRSGDAFAIYGATTLGFVPEFERMYRGRLAADGSTFDVEGQPHTTQPNWYAVGTAPGWAPLSWLAQAAVWARSLMPGVGLFLFRETGQVLQETGQPIYLVMSVQRADGAEFPNESRIDYRKGVEIGRDSVAEMARGSQPDQVLRKPFVLDQGERKGFIGTISLDALKQMDEARVLALKDKPSVDEVARLAEIAASSLDVQLLVRTYTQDRDFRRYCQMRYANGTGIAAQAFRGQAEIEREDRESVQALLASRTA